MATQDQLEKRRIVGDYVRERLVAECAHKWGHALEIAKRTGFSAAHVSNVKDGNRNVGDSFAMAMANYWGMTYSQLEKVALGQLAERLASYGAGQSTTHQKPLQASADPMPQLTMALAECGDDLYSIAFLKEYEQQARGAGIDRPRNIWLADLEVKFWEWRQEKQRQRRLGAAPGTPSDEAMNTAVEAADTSSRRSGVREAKRTKGTGKRVKGG